MQQQLDSSRPRFRSPALPLGLASLGLVLFALAVMNAGWCNWQEAVLLDRVLQGDTPTVVEMNKVESDKLTAAGMQAIVFLVTVLGFLWTLVRMHRNAESTTGIDMRHCSFACVGWFFCPILNLFMPYQVVREIWDVSDCRNGLPLVGLWWSMMILTMVFAGAANVMTVEAATAEAYALALKVAMAANFFTMVAAGLAMFMLQAMARGQALQREDRLRQLEDLEDELGLPHVHRVSTAA